ncbi:MAG TPA: DUF1320 domain-containing protein [Candidatus Binataceae bacterium]|nr:DUF1320 domain-containing protein [Candidatus Binataceae bacterium]
MSYAVPQDVINEFPNRDLVQLTNEDPTAQTVNTAFIQTALNDASSMIDSYLEARFALPLPTATIPGLLKAMCIDIAMYRMQALRPLHDLDDARKRYEDALKALEKINQGKLTLGLATDNSEPAPDADEVVVLAGGDPSGRLPSRIFNRGNLRGF